MLITEREHRDFLQIIFSDIFHYVEVTPFHSGGSDARSGLGLPEACDSNFMEGLWRNCDARGYGLCCEEFSEILATLGAAQNYGLPIGEVASGKQQMAFFARLKLSDLALARACAMGKEPAWKHFLAAYREPVARAATGIAGNETLGHDLADALYGELYGLNARNEQRNSPFNSYTGAGKLIVWLYTLLAQRNVDRHRRTHRESPLGDHDEPDPGIERIPSDAELTVLGRAVRQAVRSLDPDDRYLLKAYFLDERTLKQIAHVLGVVHESTPSRRLGRLTKDVRKRLLRNLQDLGLSKREAEERLGTDPRDLGTNLTKMLQDCEPQTFFKKARR